MSILLVSSEPTIKSRKKRERERLVSKCFLLLIDLRQTKEKKRRSSMDRKGGRKEGKKGGKEGRTCEPPAVKREI